MKAKRVCLINVLNLDQNGEFSVVKSNIFILRMEVHPRDVSVTQLIFISIIYNKILIYYIPCSAKNSNCH